jgi:hypothetical protein
MVAFIPDQGLIISRSDNRALIDATCCKILSRKRCVVCPLTRHGRKWPGSSCRASSEDVADYIWRTVVQAFKWVLWDATIALVAAIGVSLSREVDQAYVQILLTVFTTVAGIFAGFISGRALGNTTGG